MSKSGGNIYYNLLERVSKAMIERGYCLPPQVQGVHHDDTGAVIALVLYFIMREQPKISKKKIKCYLLLLNRICRYKEKGDIVRWQLNDRSLYKFIDVLINFMKEKKLIRMNGNSKSQFVVDEGSALFADILHLLPPNVIYWVESMLQVCKKKTGEEMQQNLLPSVKGSDNDLISTLTAVIDKHTNSNNHDSKNQKQSKPKKSSNSDAKTASEWQKLIDQHEKDSNK